MERENDPQAIANILRANQLHLEILHLELPHYDERDPAFLPPNLKYLCVMNQFDHGNQVLAEMAAEQCPKLYGLKLDGRLSLRTINAISRFEKFVV